MLLRNKLAYLLVALLPMTSSFANPQSSSISLDDMTIPAGKTVGISFMKLYSGVNYFLSCNIKNANPNAKNQLMDVIFSTYLNDIHLYIDQNEASFNKITQFQASGSTLALDVVNQNSDFSIRNLDYTDDIVLFNCVADLIR